METPRPTEIPLICLLLLCMGVMSGCDNSMDGFEQGRELFSVYGFLDMDREENFIRVQDLTNPLIGDSTRHIDATVTLENLSTGFVEVLQDCMVVFDDVSTHNFRTTQSIDHGTEYRLKVENSEGESVEIIATSPLKAQYDVNPPHPGCKESVQITFDPVYSINDLSLTIGIEYQQKMFSTPRGINLGGSSVTGPVTATFSPGDIPRETLGTFRWENLTSDYYTVEYTIVGPDYHSNTGNIPRWASRFGIYYEDSFEIPVDYTECIPREDQIISI